MSMGRVADHLDGVIPERMAALKLPGAAFSLVEKGVVTDVRCYGLADIASQTPVTPDTRFSLQSISKSFAAWAVMTLVDAGRVDLDAPISTYHKRWQLPPSAYDVTMVTARRLLSHHAGISTSGIHGIVVPRTSQTLVDGLKAQLPARTAEQELYYAKWSLPDDEPVSLDFPPGREWRYSNGGFAMLELMIEDVTGQAYADYVIETILKPLGMSQSGFDRDAAAPFATPHDAETGAPVTDYRWPSLAAAGLYATAGDLALFAAAAMTGPNGEPPGRGIVSPAALAEMHSPHGLADKTPTAQFEAGLGHLLLKGDGPMNVHHSGGSIGWRSICSFFPETGDGFSMLINSDGGNELWIPLIVEWREALMSA